MWEDVPSDMCAQRRLKSDCASAQSDLSLRCLRCPYEETLHSLVIQKAPSKGSDLMSEYSFSDVGAHITTYFTGKRKII